MIPLSYCVYLILIAEIERRKAKGRLPSRDYLREVQQLSQADANFVLGRVFRSQIYAALRGGVRNSRSALRLLGCTIPEYRKYLESKFHPHMTWEFYGRRGWHVDHIRPCSSFDLRDPVQQKLCFHYSNTQPLWAMDNYRKGDKYLVAAAAVENPEVVEARRQAYSLDKLAYAS